MVFHKLNDVTFAIPTYNRNEYLKKLLESIPSGLGVKFAISDNGNFVLDDTIKKHASNLKIAHSEKVIEMYDNWNKAISLVDTTWFLIPSDDDLYYAENFSTIDKALTENPDADIFIFGHHVIDENDHVKSTWSPENGVFMAPNGFEIFKYGVNARFPSILFRTEFVNKMGKIDTTYEFTAGDSLLIQKCLINGKSVFINEVIGAYRTWSNNFTNQLIGSKKWLDKIDRWQNELAEELSKIPASNFDGKKIKDEVYARNLLEGILTIRKTKQGVFKSMNFVLKNRYPWNAKFTTHLHILKSLIIG